MASTPYEMVVAAYLDAAVDSANTRRAYSRHLRDAFTFLGRATLADITGADLAALRARVVANGLSPLSQSLALAAMRSFLAWAGSMGAHRLPSEVVHTALRIPSCFVQRPYSALSEPEIHDLLAAAPTTRDRALLAVLLGAGLRVAESVALDVEDVIEDGDGGTMLGVRQGKGRKDRQVPVGVEVAAVLRSYLAATGRVLGDVGPLSEPTTGGPPDASTTGSLAVLLGLWWVAVPLLLVSMPSMSALILCATRSLCAVFGTGGMSSRCPSSWGTLV
jgi:integrase/recombinase XerC